MPEAITRFAINSTLGTENFQPLDEIIVANTRMVASDELYATLDGFDERLEVFPSKRFEYVYPQKIKMTRFGTMKLEGIVNRIGSISNISFDLYIYKNREEIYYTSKGMGEGGDDEKFSAIISFEPYDVLEFKIIGNAFSNSYYLQMKDISIYGSIKQNVFNII